MSIAALIRSMASAGAPPEAIALAVEAIEAAEAKIAAVRATARDRKRRQRAASNDEDDGTVTGQSRDADGTVTDGAFLDKEGFQTFQEIKPIPVEAKRARATRIRKDWIPEKPLPANVAALVAQWPPGREQRELEGLVAYWTARNRDAARTDWDLVWHNRIRDQHDRIIRESQHGRSGLLSQAATRRGGTANDLYQRLTAEQPSAGSG